MEQVKNYILLFLTILSAILLVDKCSSVPCNELPGRAEVISSKVVEDSTRTHEEKHSDTTSTWIKEELSEVPKLDFEKYESYYESNNANNILDSIIGMDLSDTAVLNSRVRTFYYGKKDSLLEYTVLVKSEKKPKSVQIEYSVHQFNIKDSVYVRDSVHVKQTDKVRVNQLYVGIDAIAYPNLNAAFLGLDFVSKKGWQIEGGVGVDVTNKNLMGMVGVKKLITFRRKK